jgi:hypothetical protein
MELEVNTMANWCNCTLEVSGEKVNIKRFLLEVFVCSERRLYCLVHEDGNSLTLSLPKTHDNSAFYVKDSNRNIVNSREIKWHFTDPVLTIDNYAAAWCIDPDFIANLSDKYQLKLRISGRDEMEAFEFEVVVDKGCTVKEEMLEF